MNKKQKYILLILILAFGFFLKIYNIENTPPGVYPDEAVNGIDAMTANDTGNYQWFYPANNGREGLFMNLIALCFKLWGISVLTLKLPSIIFGTLTILGTYLLTKELFNKDRLALISSFLVASGFWAINFSRISFRANMLPTVLVFSFYFLYRGIKYKKYRDFIFGGLVFGLGLHTYIAYRISPAILVVMLATFLFTREKFIKNYWKHLAVFSVFTLLAMAPMFYTFYTHPEYVESRSGSISILSPEVNQGHLVMTFLRSFSLSLVKYNFWGDQNWRHNYPPYPLLDPITGIAFAFGLVYSIIRLLRLLYLRFVKKENHEKLEVYMLLLSWFFLMLAPEFMTAEGNPHALRAIGTLPVTFIFSALLFEYFFRKGDAHGGFFKKSTYVIVTLMVIAIGTFNAVKYHYFWANNPMSAQSFDKNLMEISDYLKTLPAEKEKFVIAECMQRIPVQLFNWNKPNVHYLYPAEIDSISPRDPNNFEIILTDRNDELISNLEEKFPRLQMEEVKDRFGMSYYILK